MVSFLLARAWLVQTGNKTFEAIVKKYMITCREILGWLISST